MKTIAVVAGLVMLAGVAVAKPSKNDVQCAETVAEAVAECEARHANDQPTPTPACPEVRGYQVCKQRRNGECRPTRTYLTPVYK